MQWREHDERGHVQHDGGRDPDADAAHPARAQLGAEERLRHALAQRRRDLRRRRWHFGRNNGKEEREEAEWRRGEDVRRCQEGHADDDGQSRKDRKVRVAKMPTSIQVNLKLPNCLVSLSSE